MCKRQSKRRLAGRNAGSDLAAGGTGPDYPVDVRFIELMPIGFGTTLAGLSEAETLSLLVRAYPDLAATGERRGNGPASYYQSRYLQGRIGFIAANTMPSVRPATACA